MAKFCKYHMQELTNGTFCPICKRNLQDKEIMEITISSSCSNSGNAIPQQNNEPKPHITASNNTVRTNNHSEKPAANIKLENLPGFLIIGGIIAAIFWGGFTIVAFFQVDWFYSVLIIALTVGTLFLMNSICKKANTKPKIEKAKTISKIAVRVAAAMVVIGFLMFLICYLQGPTGHVDKSIECGLCGGSGIAFDKVCTLCDGAGGGSRSDARYTPETYNLLGVLIASSGIAIIFGTRKIKKNNYI